MLQRVGLAQALINEPEVLFLDEPMSGLDPLGRRDVRQLILRLRDEGRTVFFSSHILADAEALCSRVGDPRRRAAGRERPARRPAGVAGARLGSGDEPVPPALAARVRHRTSFAATSISDGRYTFELRLDPPPAAFCRDSRRKARGSSR